MKTWQDFLIDLDNAALALGLDKLAEYESLYRALYDRYSEEEEQERTDQESRRYYARMGE